MKGLIITAVIAALLGLSVECRAADITLRQSAGVGRGFVRLSDIAVVEGFETEIAAKINSIFCGSSPLPGESRTIVLSYVKMRLEQSGQDVRNIRFKGATEVKVTSSAIVKISWPEEKPRPASKPAVAEPAGTLKERIVARIVGIIAEREALNPADISITIRRLGRTLEKAPDTSKITSVRQIGRRGTSSKAVCAVDIDTGKARRSGTVTADVQIIAAVVVAKRDIAAGTRLAAEDVETARIPISGSPDRFLHSVSEALGKETGRAIAKGEPVPGASAKKPVVMKRGDIVQVTVRCAGKDISVKTTGIVQQSGRLGEMVKVKNAASGKEFMAKVVGGKDVEVIVGAEK